MILDESESIWKIDGPIGRSKFFWDFVKSLLFLLPIYLLKSLVGITPGGDLGLIILVAMTFGLASFWVYFCATSKRYYDIIGNKRDGILIAIGSYILSFIFRPTALVILLIGLFAKGKYISTDKVEEIEERETF